MGETGGGNVDRMQIGQRVDNRKADSTPHVWQILDGHGLLVPNDEAMPPFHHVEHRTNDGRILAEGVDAGRQLKHGMDGRQPAILASHVVRGRGDRPERRPPDDELRGAEAHVIGEVRVSSGELRDEHGLAIVELRQVRRGLLVAEPRLEAGPVEIFAGTNRSDVGGSHAPAAPG